MNVWDRASLILAGGLILLIALTFGQYGNGFDAEVQDIYGQQVLAWFRTFGQDRSALSYLDLYFYGGMFDLLAAIANLVSPFGHWATRHLLEALFGLIGLAGAWRLARHLGGAAAGFAALAALALTPSFYGMMFINPKDIPFAALMIWALYCLTRLAEDMPRPNWRRIGWFGLTTGLALSMRVGGVLIFAYLGLCLLVWLARRRGKGIVDCLRVSLPSFALAWLVMLTAWPWAQVSPILHPVEAIRHFAAMQNNIGTLFFGHMIGRLYHPASYLPVYLVLKLPDLMLVLLLAGLPFVWRRGVPFRFLPLTTAALFPILYAVVADPELYDAERHFLFLLPPLAVLTGLAAVAIARWTPSKRAYASLVILGCAWQGYRMWDLHPYEYAFFNDLIGGVRGAAGAFETEYWGVAMAEATGDLSRYVAAHHLARTQPWKVAICGKPTQMGDGPYPDLQSTTDWKSADFFVASTRGDCEARMPGRVIGEVERDGVPFAVVKDMRAPQQASVAN